MYETFTREEAKKLGIMSMPPVNGGVKPGGEDVYEMDLGRQGNSS